MNSKNKILVGCLSLLLVLSVGYALFSDTITINGSATAKGEFKLTTTCLIAPQEDITPATVGEYKLQYSGISMNEISCEDNNISISTTLDYPGAYAWYKIVVTNEGSINAILKSVEYVEENFTIDETTSYINHFTGDPISISFHSSEIGDEINEYYYEQLHQPMWTLFGYEFTDKLPPEKSFVYYILVRWNTSDTTQRPEGVTANYTFKLNFEQATN